jgi:hypothetical protein
MKRIQIYLQIVVLALAGSVLAYAEHRETPAGTPPPVEQQVPSTDPAIPQAPPLPADPAAVPTAPVPMTVDKNACKDDAKKFCAGIRGGRGRIWSCLKQNEAALTPACQVHLQQMKERLEKKKEQVTSACYEDKEKFCKDVLPGDGRIARCMQEHREQLTPACQETLKKNRLSGRKPPSK